MWGRRVYLINYVYLSVWSLALLPVTVWAHWPYLSTGFTQVFFTVVHTPDWTRFRYCELTFVCACEVNVYVVRNAIWTYMRERYNLELRGLVAHSSMTTWQRPAVLISVAGRC